MIAGRLHLRSSPISSHGLKEHIGRLQSIATFNDQISFIIVSSQLISANVPSAVKSKLAHTIVVERMKREWDRTRVPEGDLRFKL